MSWSNLENSFKGNPRGLWFRNNKMGCLSSTKRVPSAKVIIPFINKRLS